MTQDEIIEMARQSGAMFDHITWVERDLLPVFERFAKLVADKALSKQEHNFCSRCGKRTADLTTIHTCTPLQD